MPALAGPVAAFAVLLVLGGASKVRRPGDTVRALQALRLPASAALVRSLAGGEMLIGGTALAVGGPLPVALVGASYLGFACFVALAMRRGGTLSSCGCFGTPDTPPTVGHLLVTLVASVVALTTAAVGPADPTFEVLGDQPLFGVPFLALTGLCAWFSYLALTALPRLTALARASS